MSEFRETFTYRGRVVGELVVPGRLLNPGQEGHVTTEVSRWSWWWFRATDWLRRRS